MLVNRPTIEDTMLDIAIVLSRRATCRKLAVGCVLTDKYNRIIGTGYNGNPRELPHCIDVDCGGGKSLPGSGLCQAVHAETNALLSCADTESIVAAYVTHAPCLRCIKMLLNTSCQRIIYLNSSTADPSALLLWEQARGIGSIYQRSYYEAIQTSYTP